jgi:CubicO group peptidase (beta-lactamase class C family)
MLALRLVALGKIDLDALIGSPFPSWVTWRHALARVSTPPSRADHLIWRYSGSDDWPWLHRKLEAAGSATLDVLVQTLLLDPIGASLTPNWEADGAPTEGKPDRGIEFRTLRVDGSPYEMAKIGLLMQREGEWKGAHLFDAGLWRVATGGGLNGDGYPNNLEAWQTHLIKGGDHSDRLTMKDRTKPGELMATVPSGRFAAGGTSRGYVVDLFDRDLVVARVRRSGVYLDQFLPGLIASVEIQ